jgi:hypothetical protein
MTPPDTLAAELRLNPGDMYYHDAVVQGLELEPGILRFNSKIAMTQYIARFATVVSPLPLSVILTLCALSFYMDKLKRFPYLLQSDSVFKKTILGLGWRSVRGNKFSPAGDRS